MLRLNFCPIFHVSDSWPLNAHETKEIYIEVLKKCKTLEKLLYEEGLIGQG